MHSQTPYDICIVGAGVAGATLAAYLAPSGLKIALIEKEWEAQDRIVGELLQPGGVKILEELGLLHLLNDIDAQDVNGYAIYLNEKHFSIVYPTKNSNQPIRGRGFHNHLFLTNVRTQLEQYSNIDIYIGTADSYIEENNRISGVQFTCANQEKRTIYARLNVFTDGIFSHFRPFLTSEPKTITSYFLGMILKNCEVPHPHFGHVIVSDNIPCLIYPISSHEYRMLIDFKGENPPRKSEELKRFLKEDIGKNIPASILPSYEKAIQEGKFKVMPNHRLPAKPNHIKGSVILGDALNMRHPLTGGGMTVAFTDVQLLGNLLLSIPLFSDLEKTDIAIETFYKTRNQNTASINILADALYGVFSNENLRDGCYEYLAQGGKKASEPISILAAINRDKTLLEKHFFAVAAYGARKEIVKSPLKGIKLAHRSMSEAVKIVAPLIESESPSFSEKILLQIAKTIAQ